VIATGPRSPLRDLTRPAHVCWVVDDDATYVRDACDLLVRGKQASRKPLAFGPLGGSLERLKPVAAVSLDPRLSILDGGPLQPETMLEAYSKHTALARAEGFQGICVVADMDWLLPAKPTTADIIGYELLLDQVVAKLDATVVCAYRRGSFDVDAIAGAQTVHAVDLGAAAPPLFRLVAEEDELWHLSGEIDLAVSSHLAAALTTVTAQDRCEIDVTGLEFIDVRGMTTLADAARSSRSNVRLLGASRVLQRHWELAGFDEYAPTVEFVA
jgi:anti-anti-sigma factor